MRDSKPTSPAITSAQTRATATLVVSGDAALATVSGLVDERFSGLGQVTRVKSLVIDVSGITRMTSFGVRQWLKAIDLLPKSIEHLYLLACPTFFVDQLNMVLNFGGAAKILSVAAPYSCPSCGVESAEAIDVLTERANLLKGIVPENKCSRCGGKLELDESPESYFSFVAKCGATALQPAAALLLAKQGRYRSQEAAGEKLTRTIKLVHGSVSYFRIIGTIGVTFRSRPFLVGAEGEVVIDLAEVDRFEPVGQREWRRLLKTLATQVPSITLVDVTESCLVVAGDSLALSRSISVASVQVPYGCLDCGWTSNQSVSLASWQRPFEFEARECTACGGEMVSELAAEALAPLAKANTSVPIESAKVIEQRAELLGKALMDEAGEGSGASAGDDMILGKYKIVRKISAGGMAEVFLANQVGIGGFEKPVALKRIQHKLLDSRRQAIEFFLNEAKMGARLAHPNIVQVLDVGEVGGALYLAMEFVHGKDLREVAKQLRANKTTMPLGETCYVVREVAQALHHAYWSTDMAGNRMSVVHRDISPHNIMLGYDGTVKLLDFGVAMSAITEHSESVIVGKWTYMSPETTMNGFTDHRSDLFSLGVILYLLCSGQAPFFGNDPKEIVAKIRAGRYQPLDEVAPEVPEQLAKLVRRMLAPDPAARPQRGQEIVAELNEITRTFGISSSAAGVADLLNNMFPITGTPLEDDTGGQTVKEVVRVQPDEPAIPRTSTSQHYSPSITPSAQTAHRLSDVSETYRRTSSASIGHRPSAPSILPPAPRSTPRVRLAFIFAFVIAIGLAAGAYYLGYMPRFW